MCVKCNAASHSRNRIAVLSASLYLGQALLGASIPEDSGKEGFVASIADTIGSSAFAAGAETSDDDEGTVKWTCPMHPHYIANEFGTCPICGMDLVKLETGNDTGATSAAERTIVSIAPEMIQNMGVRLGKAEISSFGRSIRSFGIVQENERQVSEITARVEGWVEQLTVTAVGDQVKRGMPLFQLYSPQLIISQNDYMLSRRNKNMAGRGLKQLEAFGVQQQVLKQIEKRKKPMELVPVYAERSGTVSAIELREGAYIKRGMLLARIQDYSSVWLIVGVAEKDLAFIGKGANAQVTFPNLPGRDITAKVDYIYPTIDSATRTGQVRLVINNPDGQIRPGSYADVEFKVDTEQRIAVPSESILTNGDGKHIVVSLGQGRFQPVQIETGLSSGSWTEVTSGVKAGDDVVVSGQFLLDSESALRESFRKLERLQLPLSLLALDDNGFAMIDHIVDAGLYLHEALVDGYDLDPAQLDSAISIKDLMWPQFKDTQLAFVLEDATTTLTEAKSAKTESEIQASLLALVQALEPWIIDGAPEHYQEKQLAIFEDSEGRRWFQVGGPGYNPYGREKGVRVALEKAEENHDGHAASDMEPTQ